MKKDYESILSEQELDVFNFMRSHGSITFLEAVKIGCGRLSARIYDMKAKGVPIKSELVKVLNCKGDECRVARYWLAL